MCFNNSFIILILVVNLLLLASCNIGDEGDEVAFNNNNNNAVRKQHVTMNGGGIGKNNSGDRYINHVNGKKNEASSGAKDYLMRDYRNGYQQITYSHNKSKPKHSHPPKPTFASSRMQKNYEEILPMIRHFETNYGMASPRNIDKYYSSNKNEYQKFNHTSILSRISRESPSSKSKSSVNVKKRTAIDDHVSKNISMLLETLLQNYENSQIPTHGQGVPTIVQTNILIRSMGPVSELDMEYSMDCYFRQYWRDTRLAFKGSIENLSLNIKMLERIWKPDTYFFNGKHSHVHTITVPNKLLRLNQAGDILYSIRLTVKASCPMQLRNFPMDRQSCPLVIGSYGYTSNQIRYEWQNANAVNFVPGMALSQFDVFSFPQGNFTFIRREGEFSVLQVSFNMQRHTGYFLIQVYVPCILIVVLSWVGFWIHREATSDRVGLGITTVLTLSTISLDSRTDLPKVRYATALDWFLLMSFFYCIATLLEFAGVHFFTKVGSGEIHLAEAVEWEDIEETEEIGVLVSSTRSSTHDTPTKSLTKRRSSSMICPIYNDPAQMFRSSTSGPCSGLSTMERQTQTENRVPKWRQIWLCFLGDEKFKRDRERDVRMSAGGRNRYVNSVSLIDRTARVVFPASFTILNILYWLAFYTYQKDFLFQPIKGAKVK